MTLMKVCLFMGGLSTIFEPTIHLCQAICWLLWQPACWAHRDPPLVTSWRQIGGGSCIAAITSSKLGQFTIFSAMKRHCCRQHCFLREGMMRVWEWNGAVLYKEDYKDKTTLTSLKFEDTSGETWRLSKSSCLLKAWKLAVLCALANMMNRTELQILSFTSGVKSWHLSEKHFSKWQPSTWRTKPPCFRAEDIFSHGNSTNK